MQVAAFAGSDVGRVREGNEDSYYVGETVFAVADGMGGHQAGEVASETALEPLATVDGRDFDSAEDADVALAEALRVANSQVVSKAERNPDLRGMGTTLTAVLIRDDALHIAHVGDSRAYLLRHAEPIRQLTTDHTLVERLIQEGRLSREDAATHPQRNVITRAIGNEHAVDVDTLLPLPLQDGDQVLLCSDGLTGPVADGDIARILDSTEEGEEAVAGLIAAANDAGGPDNITVVLLRLGRTGTAERMAVAPEASVGAPPASVGAGAMAGGVEASASEGSAHPQTDAVHQIRTGSEPAQDDWARTMGRIGARQGVDRRGSGRATPSTGRGKRVLAGLLATVVLLAVIVGGGWFLLSRAYFVGVHDGDVAVFRGLPQGVGGFELSWVVEGEVSDISVSDLPVHLQQNVNEGLSAGTIDEARRIIVGLQRQIEQSDDGATAEPSPTMPTPSASPSPGA